MNKYFIGLKCTDCGKMHPDTRLPLLCEGCGGFLEAAYDYGRLAREVSPETLAGRRTGMWKYAEILPVREEGHVKTLQEGGTPLIWARALGEKIGLKKLFLKDETRNPTGTFKDRGASVTVSKCVELGVKQVIISSSGNAAASFAAYSAIGGLECYALLRTGSRESLLSQTAIYGARTFVVQATVNEAGELANRIGDELGWLNCAVPTNLYRVEGKKTQAYEIAEQLGWQAPDRIVCPTGGGTNIMAIWKGCREMVSMGWLKKLPAMVCIQPAGCAPVVRAFKEGQPIRSWGEVQTIALGLGVRKPLGGDQVVKILGESRGTAETVIDDEIRAAEYLLARTEGIFAEPSAAASVAGVIKLARERRGGS